MTDDEVIEKSETVVQQHLMMYPLIKWNWHLEGVRRRKMEITIDLLCMDELEDSNHFSMKCVTGNSQGYESTILLLGVDDQKNPKDRR